MINSCVINMKTGTMRNRRKNRRTEKLPSDDWYRIRKIRKTDADASNAPVMRARIKPWKRGNAFDM